MWPSSDAGELPGADRELQEALFYDKDAVDRGVDLRLRPGGRFPGDKVMGPSKPIAVGPPGVMQPPRDGLTAWKDDSWRSPFKGVFRPTPCLCPAA